MFEKIKFQLKQFSKPFPAKDSWAYNLACFVFALQSVYDDLKGRKHDDN